MTSRTSDYNCPRCGKYLFSAYTYRMSPDELRELDKQAARKCKCRASCGWDKCPHGPDCVHAGKIWRMHSEPVRSGKEADSK